MTSWIYIYIIIVIISCYLCTGSLMVISLLVFLAIMKNVISFIRNIKGRLWGHPVTSSMTSSSWKYVLGIMLDDLFISEVKLKLCLIFRNFQKGRHFELATNFFTGSYTGSWINQRDSHEHFRHFELLIDAVAQILTEIYHFQNLTYFVICDVISDAMSAWNITCTTRHPQQCTCKMLFVWHQSFIVESSGQTSWQTWTDKEPHTHTNKHTWWKHYPLAIAGDKHKADIEKKEWLWPHVTLCRVLIFGISGIYPPYLYKLSGGKPNDHKFINSPTALVENKQSVFISSTRTLHRKLLKCIGNLLISYGASPL